MLKQVLLMVAGSLVGSAIGGWLGTRLACGLPLWP